MRQKLWLFNAMLDYLLQPFAQPLDKMLSALLLLLLTASGSQFSIR
jgi:hypothetical protein